MSVVNTLFLLLSRDNIYVLFPVKDQCYLSTIKTQMKRCLPYTHTGFQMGQDCLFVSQDSSEQCFSDTFHTPCIFFPQRVNASTSNSDLIMHVKVLGTQDLM